MTVEQVLAEMEFTPKMADKIEVLDPPTEEEITVLRTQMDVQGQFSSADRIVVRQDGGSYALVRV